MEIKREYTFDGVGRKDMYLLHSGDRVAREKHPGVRRIRFFMTFGSPISRHEVPGESGDALHLAHLYEGREIVPIQFLGALLPDPASLGSRTKGKTNIGCIFRGKKDGKKRTYYVYNICDHQEASGDRLPGHRLHDRVPAMIGAKLLLEGVWRGAGVFNIEEFDPDPFMAELGRRASLEGSFKRSWWAEMRLEDLSSRATLWTKGSWKRTSRFLAA
jgi:saccharopine dehydrogenase (NAD+, L-lysine-forming)